MESIGTSLRRIKLAKFHPCASGTLDALSGFWPLFGSIAMGSRFFLRALAAKAAAAAATQQTNNVQSVNKQRTKPKRKTNTRNLN